MVAKSCGRTRTLLVDVRKRHTARKRHAERGFAVKSKGSEMLRKNRIDRNLTQHQAGMIAGVPAQQISDYERGARAPGRSAAAKIEQGLGVPVITWDEPAADDEQAAAS